MSDDLETAWKWVEFGRRLVVERDQMIRHIQTRICSQRGAISWLEHLYLDRLGKYGMVGWAKTCEERYRMLRKHNWSLAAERNSLRDRVAVLEGILGKRGGSRAERAEARLGAVVAALRTYEHALPKEREDQYILGVFTDAVRRAVRGERQRRLWSPAASSPRR